MPIYAKTKLLIEDSCIPKPERTKIELSYSGPDPDKIYPKIKDVLKKDLGIPETNIQEKEFVWDRSALPEKFSMAIDAIKEFDRFSYMLLSISVKGSVKPAKEIGKEGEAKVTIDGVVRTEYPQDTVFQKSIFYEMLRTFWHRVFYHKQFEKFKEECRDSMLKLHDILKAFFEILPK